ncbi:MAG: serine protease [Caldilineaceae bacterium]|nr:serine protease [Caldilineaceae bacterium]
MHRKWQLWLSCVLLFTVSVALIGRYGSPESVSATVRTATTQSTAAQHHVNPNSLHNGRTTSLFRSYDSNSPQTPTIIGGEEAPQGAWPWMVALVDANKSNAAQGQFCGGVLIDAEWVLSAAHCTVDLSGRALDPAKFNVVIGRHQLSESGGQRVAVDQLVRHPAYGTDSFDNDLALLHLTTPVDTPPLPLLQPDQPLYESSGTPVVILGWGITDEGRDSDVLRQVEVPLVDLKTCRQSYGIFNEKVTDNMLCAGLKNGGKDSCQGDSGGPMIVFDVEHQEWRQLGIVSWGEGCAEPNYYGVYTRVSQYTRWIGEQIPQQGTTVPTPTPRATLTPTSTATPTPQLNATPTNTLIPTALATPFATPSATADNTTFPTPSVTPQTAQADHTMYLPLIMMNRYLVLQNGNFEAIHQGWTEFSLQQQPLIVHAAAISTAARGGSYIAQLGAGESEVAYIQQRVTVPPTKPILEFWMKITSADDCGYDFGGVVLDEHVVAQFDLCRSSASADWQRWEVDLRAYQGLTVSLEIRAETDGFLNSTLLIDDVTFIAVTDTVTAQADRAAGQPLTRTSPATPIWTQKTR